MCFSFRSTVQTWFKLLLIKCAALLKVKVKIELNLKNITVSGTIYSLSSLVS